MTNFVYGNAHRIFINTVIGCRAKCEYCYVPKMEIKKKFEYITAKKAIAMVNELDVFIPGKEGTIISIGCYSECLDPHNVSETAQIVAFFLGQGNYVQLATKQKLSSDLCELFSKKMIFPNQLNVYISMPSYSYIPELEPGTASLKERENNIKQCKKYNIGVVLYIKPYIPTITHKDLKNYILLIEKYCIPVIVGNYLTTSVTKKMAEVGEKILYECDESNLMKEFYNSLKDYTLVFTHSTDYIFYLRNK